MSWRAPGYTQLRELGSGGGGSVVLARHDASGTVVAIKYLSEQLLNDEGFRVQFRREAELLGELGSPYVARLYEYIETASGAAIVMEAVQGVTLRELIKRSGPTGPEAALVVLKGSLLGLAAAHRRGVVHRDYKPANVLVDLAGASKLVDFGIAVRQGAAAKAAGTALYMAPEQWDDHAATPQTDIYAATATVVECLKGTPPFTAENKIMLAAQHLTQPVDLTGVPGPLHNLVQRGMAKEPAQRPGDALAFVAELDAAATRTCGKGWEERGRAHLAARVAALAFLLPIDGTDAEAVSRAPTGAALGRSRRVRTAMKVGGAAVVVAAAVVLGTLVVNALPRDTPIPQPGQAAGNSDQVNQALAAYDQWRQAAAARDLAGLCRLNHQGAGFGHPDYPPGTCPTVAEEVRGWLESTAFLAERLGEADPAAAEAPDADTVVLHGISGDPPGRPNLVTMRRQDGVWRVAMA